MDTTSPFNLDSLFDGSLQRLRIEAEYFSRLTDHSPEIGRLNESHLVRLLREYLPPKFGIGTGFIVCGGTTPRQSPQCDIVLYDAVNNAPLYASEAWSIFPIEMVYGVIEVKTRLTTQTLEDAFTKCASIRAMAKTPDGGDNKSYATRLAVNDDEMRNHIYSMGLPPRFFVFGYGGWQTAESLRKSFVTHTSQYDGAHIHGVVNLHEHGSLFVQHIAFQPAETRTSQIHEDGFRRFLMALPKTLNSMLPPHREGAFFDPVNLAHYPTGPTSADEGQT